jgi:hypothetical protein
MKYLRVNKNNYSQPEIHTKQAYGRRVTNIDTISKQKNILITGAHHSGKSRMIHRLFDDCEGIWLRQVQPYKYSNNKASLQQDKPMLKKGGSLEDWQFPEPVMLNGITPLSKWTEHQGVKEWYESKGEGEYKKVPAWKRVELIPDYLKDTRAILFIDDAHKLTGRKLMIAKSCMKSGYRVIVASSDENRLSPSIRKLFLDTKPQIIRLNSDVAYDATHLVVWAFVAIMMATGMTELAMILGLFETLKGGRRGSKQD